MRPYMVINERAIPGLRQRDYLVCLNPSACDSGWLASNPSWPVDNEKGQTDYSRKCRWRGGPWGFGYYASGLPASGCVASPRLPDARVPARFSSLFGQRQARFESFMACR